MVRLLEVGLGPGKRTFQPLATSAVIGVGVHSPMQGLNALGNFRHLAGLRPSVGRWET